MPKRSRIASASLAALVLPAARGIRGRLIAGLLLSGLTACAHVQPYEREYLTRPGMDLTGELQAAEFEAHVQSAREGAIGGRNTVESTGGGCGCN